MQGSQLDNCPSEQRIRSCLEDELPGDEQAVCLEHVDACPRCAAVLEHAASLRGLEPELHHLRESRDELGSQAWLDRALASLRGRFGPEAQVETRTPPPLSDFEDIVEVRRGGQGIVYRAVQKSTGRSVAIKALRGGALSDPSTRARFEREVRILGQLDDQEGVCPIVDCIVLAEEIFLVMPYVEGETLAQRLARAAELRRKGALPKEAWAAITGPEGDSHVPEASTRTGSPQADTRSPKNAQASRGDLRSALRMMERVARAAHVFHERGIVHRDLTPRNIILRPDGRPVILDFGLALDRDGAEAGRLTREGELFGTPVYMAPEQIEGRAAKADARTDVYSLGVILYELLTFRAPFEGPRTKVILQRILRGAFPPPRKLNSAIPRDLEAVCLKAMEQEPSRRYGTALELAEDLRRVRVLESTVAKPLSPATRLLRRARRNPWAVGGFGAALLSALIAFQMRREQAYVVDAAVNAAQVLLNGIERGAFAEDELRFLKDEIGVDDAAAKLLEARYEDILSDVREKYRGAGDPEIRLVNPRRATASLRPSFRFAVSASAAPAERVVRVETETEGTVLAEKRVASAPTDGGLVNVELPVALDPGTRYRWSVCDAEGNPEAVETFRVVDSALVEARRAALKSSGDPAVDVLLGAATELAFELARPALEHLERFPDGASPALQRLRRVLEARAFLLLGEGDNALERLGLAEAVQSPEERPMR